MDGSGASEEVKLAFLREVGAESVRHVRVSLYEHSLATRDLLAAWKAPAAWCDAGLFHAVYGTEELDPRLEHPPLDPRERERVRALIGGEAERLVWLFRSVQRKRFVAWLAGGARGTPPMRRGEPPEALSDDELRGLANLIVANALEQLPRRRHGYRRRALSQIRLEPHLLPDARAALRRERSWWRRLRRRWDDLAAGRGYSSAASRRA